MDSFSMKDVFEARNKLKKEGQATRMMTDEGIQPKAKHFYTVSADFAHGDRSWISDFWEVLSVNGANAYVRIHREHGSPVEKFFPISERSWYLADDAWRASKHYGGKM